jgi:hypothetical protein
VIKPEHLLSLTSGLTALQHHPRVPSGSLLPNPAKTIDSIIDGDSLRLYRPDRSDSFKDPAYASKPHFNSVAVLTAGMALDEKMAVENAAARPSPNTGRVSCDAWT